MSNRISLRFAEIRDYETAYRWLFFSDFSELVNQPAEVSADSLPSYEEFKHDYLPYFFDGSAPEKGRSFIIQLDKTEDIGHISYTSFHLLDGITEFDIWLSELKYTGKSYGTYAISQLAERVFSEGYTTIIIRPARNNIRAIRSYQKAGFKPAEMIPEKYYKPEFIKLYANGDTGKGNDEFMTLEKV
ncbi:MAG: GNAT family N-acetyltransferase [Bacteroidales bacterium]|jgi:RimJ/RimL family protein N-acetyltransferase